MPICEYAKHFSSCKTCLYIQSCLDNPTKIYYKNTFPLLDKQEVQNLRDRYWESTKFARTEEIDTWLELYYEVCRTVSRGFDTPFCQSPWVLAGLKKLCDLGVPLKIFHFFS